MGVGLQSGTGACGMGMEIVEKSGKLLAVKVTGRLKASELKQAQRAAIDIIKSEGKIRVLVYGENFQGWEKSDDWGDVSFQLKYDEHIEKIAIVGTEKWEDLVTAFLGKGLREVPMKYFSQTELAKARAWVA